MKRFTILLFLVLCTVFSLQAQNVTLPYTQDFAALSQGDMNSDTGSPTPVSAGDLQGIASLTRAYQAGGAIRLGEVGNVGGFTTQPITTSGAGFLKVSFKAAAWIAAMPAPAQVVVRYGSQTVTLNVPATAHVWPVTADDMNTYNVQFLAEATHSAVSITTVTAAGNETRIFLDNFKIMHSATGPRMSEGFEGTMFPPKGWTALQISGSRKWERAVISGAIGTACARVNYGYTGHHNWLITPNMAPKAGDSLTFKVKTTGYYSGTKLYIRVSTSSKDTSSFGSSVKTLSTNSEIPTSWKQYSIDLSPYVGSTIFVAFQVVDNNGLNLLLDDIHGPIVLPDADCITPKDVTIRNIITSGADISWSEVGYASSWVVEYSNQPTFAGAASQTVTGTPSLTLSGLTPNTKYYVRIKSDCLMGEYSEWSNVDTFKTRCLPMAGPINILEDFNSLDNKEIPGCWSKITTDNTYPSVVASPGHGFSGKVVRFGGSFHQYLIMQPVGEPLNTLQLDFLLSREGINSGTFQVGYMTDPNDSNTFVAVNSFNDDTYKKKLHKRVFFTNVVDNGNNRYITFRYGQVGTENFSTSSWYWIDSVTLKAAPSCRLENDTLELVRVVPDSAIIKYKLPTGYTSVEYVYGVDSIIDPTTLTPTIATGGQITIGNLSPETMYKLWIRIGCSGGTYSDWSTQPITFKTPCSYINTLDEDFEAVNLSRIPDCWSKISSMNSRPGVVNGEASNGVTSKAIKFDGSSPQYLIAPRFAVALNTLQLYFSLDREGESSGTFQVGYMTDPTDSNTFVPVASFNDKGQQFYKKMLRKRVFFTGVADNGNNRYIAFRYGKVGNENFNTYWYYWLDSISVQTAPACQPPYDIANTFVSKDSAVIGYKRPGAALSVQYAFTEYDTVADPSNLTPIQNTGTSDTIKLSGLGSNKTYKLWLRSDCGAGSVSDWTDPISFTTVCEDVTAIDENFDSIATSTLPDCWSKITKGTSKYPYVVNENIGHGTNNKTIRFGLSQPQYVVSPRIGVALNTLRLDFSLYKKGIKSGTFQVGYMTDPTDSTTFVPVASFSDKSMFAFQKMLRKSVFFKQVVDNGNNRYIAFRYGRVGDEEFSTSSYYWLDSVKLQPAPACIPPHDLVNTFVNGDSAVITYKTPIGATAVRYVYAEDSTTDDPSTLTAHTATGDTIKLPGLTRYTVYKIWMQSSCGAGTDSEWSNPLIFNTECGEDTTLSENFDNIPEGNIHGCWSKISTDNSYPSVVSAEPSAGVSTNAIKFSSSKPQYLITPRFSVPLNTLELNFTLDREGESSGAFEVGYMTNPTDASTFVSVASFDDNVYKKMLRNKVFFTDIDDNGTNRYIAFKYNPSSTFWYYWLDSVEVIKAPTCMPPSQLKIDSISTDSVVITYKLRAAATGYEYAYGGINETDPSNLTTIATGDTIKLGGLAPHTSYRLWVRSQCGPGTYSDWSSSSIAFTTRCPNILAVNEDFENVDQDSIPECWSKISSSYAKYPKVVTASTNNGVTSKAIKFFGTHPQYLIINKIDSALNKFQLRFNLNKESRECGVFQVGYMTKPTDGSTFVPVASFNDNVYKTMLPKTVYFDTIADSINKRYIAFRYGAVGAVSQSTSEAYWIDDVVLEPAVSCPAPTSLMANVAKDSVRVTFEHRPSATSWQYILAKNVPLSTTPPDSIATTNINSNNIVINNIEPNQDYTIWVRTTSCANDTSAWTVTTFSTKYCSALPNAVDEKGIVNVTYGLYNIVDNTTAAEAGNYGDYTALSGDIVAGDSAYVSITLSTEKYYKTRVYVDWNQDYNFEGTGEFVYEGTTGSGKIETLLASFLVPSYVRAGNYRMRIVSTSGIPNPCFSGSKGAVEDYTLTLGAMPTCRPTEAKNISVSNITSNSANISWRRSGLGTSWDVIVSPDELTATQLKNYTSAINVTDSSYNATGLMGNKDYYVYVRSVCSATDKSYWTWWRPVEFKTKTSVVSTPYHQDFTNSNVTELAIFPDKKASGNKWCIGSGIGNGGNSMYISKDGVATEYGNIESHTLSYITIDFGNSPKFDVQFDWIGKGETLSSTAYDFMRVYVVPDTLTLPTTWQRTDSRWIKDSSALQLGDKFNGKTVWTTFSDTLPSSYAGTRRKLVFMWFNDASGAGSPTMAVDNIYVTGYDCNSPSRFVVDTVTKDSAHISWSKGSTETSWIVEYKKLDDNTWVRDTVNDTTYSLRQLESYTEYKIRVQGICPGGSGHSGLLLGSLTTLCGEKTIGNGIVYNFDDAIGNIPTCWARTTPFTYKGLTFPLVGTFTGAPEDGVLIFGGRSTQIIATQEYREDINTLELEFDLWRESTGNSGQLEIGVMSNPYNASTFIPVHNLTSLIVVPDKYVQYTRVSMDTAIAVGKHYIAFRQVIDNPTNDTLKYGIDNLDIHPIPMCRRPNFNDISITINEYTPTTADISWIPGGYENSWEVQYKDVDSTEWNSVIVTQTSMCVLQRLKPATTYEVRLRSICTPDTSKWTITRNFSTLCEVYTLPYTETFRDMTKFPNKCWSKYTGLASDVFGGQRPQTTSSGWMLKNDDSLDTAHLRLNIYGTACKYWAVSPLIKLNENSMLQFDLSLTGYNNSDTATGTRADDQFMVIVSTDGGNTWLKANATIWNNDNANPGNYIFNNIRRSGEKVSIDLSTYANNIVRIAFYGESTIGQNGDNDLHIDNIRIFERVIVPPTVKTLPASNIGNNTATLNKDVTPGDIAINKEGFYYKPKNQGATWKLVETDDDAFVANDLIQGTTYEYYAYATLENNVNFYGDTVEFTTTGTPPVHPVVNTLAATNITQSAATLNKSVVADQSEPVTQEGWKWRKVGDPNWIISMNGNLTALEHNTQYEFFAFAKTALNQEGYQGQTLTFTTASHTPPTVQTLGATAIGMYAATLRKSVTAGSEPIIEEGWEYRRVGEVVWTKTQNANINNLAQDAEYEFYAYAVTNSYPMTKGETLKFRTLKATSDLDAADYGVNIYPNPADNVVTLAVEGLSSEAEVTIIDMMGRKVGHYLIAQGSNSITIDVSPLAEGTYAVRIVSDNATIVERLVIKKR